MGLACPLFFSYRSVPFLLLPIFLASGRCPKDSRQAEGPTRAKAQENGVGRPCARADGRRLPAQLTETSSRFVNRLLFALEPGWGLPRPGFFLALQRFYDLTACAHFALD